MDDLRKQKIDNALTFYMQAIKLKNVIRSGWKRWDIDSKRVESIAEHIYGTMMLAIAIHSELDEYKDVNLDKVLKILAIHEMEEIRIGDITPFDNVTDEEKRNLGISDFKDIFNYIDTSNITNMSMLFHLVSCKVKFSKIDISEWDVSNVTDMGAMFDNCKEFNSDLSNWNVSNVEEMCYMFNGCKKFNSDLSNWDVSNVTDMSYMFYGCDTLKKNNKIPDWCK